MIFSVPMIKALKDGKTFFFLPPLYYKTILDISVFSFGDNIAAFNDLLEMFRVAFLHNLEQIEETSLITLLDALVVRMASYDERWFKN